MALDVDVLRKSFNLVAEKEPLLASRFYPILFSRYPEAKPLFGRHSSGEQQRMLTEALVAVVDHLEDAPWLAQNLKGLGTRHVQYGVTREMYPWVGECLLATLAEIAGDAWTPALEQQWAEAYGVIVELMFAGYPEN